MEPHSTNTPPWGAVSGVVVALVLIALIIGLSHRAHAPAAGTASTTAPTISQGLSGGTSVTSSSSQAAGVTVLPTKNFSYKNPDWSIAFTLRPEWNETGYMSSTNTLHQVQITGSNLVIFISQNEAVALSSDLKYQTSTRTVAGQTVSVRTYDHPSAQFAQYQLFTLKEPDASYSFLIKNVTSDTTQTDAFIRSITYK